MSIGGERIGYYSKSKQGKNECDGNGYSRSEKDSGLCTSQITIIGLKIALYNIIGGIT